MIKFGKDAGGFIDGAGAHGGGENRGGVAGCALDLDGPRGATPTGNSGGVPDGAFEGQGDIAAAHGLEELGAGDLDRTSDGLLIAGHDDENLGVGEGAGGVERAEGVNENKIAALDVVGAGADGFVALAAEVAAGQDGVEVADQKETLALGAAVFGDKVAGAAARGGECSETIIEAEGGQLGSEEIGYLAHAGEVFARAVDLDDLFEVAVERADLGVYGVDNFLLSRREGG